MITAGDADPNLAPASMIHWTFVQGGSGLHGAQFTEARAIEYPRLTRLIQRATAEDEYLCSYHVAGIENYFHDEAEAVAAMEANPA